MKKRDYQSDEEDGPELRRVKQPREAFQRIEGSFGTQSGRGVKPGGGGEGNTAFPTHWEPPWVAASPEQHGQDLLCGVSGSKQIRKK